MLFRLVELRNKYNLMQKDIAILLSVTAATYNRYERGTLYPSIDKLIILADFYQVTLDYLLMRSDEGRISIVNDNNQDKLVYRYNLLDQRGRSAVDTLLKHEYRLVKAQRLSALVNKNDAE